MWQAKRLYMKTGDRPDWIAHTVWTKVIAHWRGKGVVKKSKANKANRSKISTNGLPVRKHTGGRRSTHDWRMVMDHFSQAIPEIMPFFGRGEEIPKELFDKADTTFVNCVRDEVKGRIYGVGNLTKEYSACTSSRPSYLSHGKVAELT